MTYHHSHAKKMTYIGNTIFWSCNITIEITISNRDALSHSMSKCPKRYVGLLEGQFPYHQDMLVFISYHTTWLAKYMCIYIYISVSLYIYIEISPSYPHNSTISSSQIHPLRPAKALVAALAHEVLSAT